MLHNVSNIISRTLVEHALYFCQPDFAEKSNEGSIKDSGQKLIFFSFFTTVMTFSFLNAPISSNPYLIFHLTLNNQFRRIPIRNVLFLLSLDVDDYTYRSRIFYRLLFVCLSLCSSIPKYFCEGCPFAAPYLSIFVRDCSFYFLHEVKH